ncbi:PAS domain S-box protein [Tundrisphaera lichenicola]|uniref:PAS domain S-box protein n=1 Tax=Tundrisphaera lichenicola TaxID=2029860 RepID=UPI003EBED7A6
MSQYRTVGGAVPVDPVRKYSDREEIRLGPNRRGLRTWPDCDEVLTIAAVAMLLDSLLGHTAFLTLFTVAVVVGARQAGWSTFGLLLTSVASLIVNEFLLPPLIELKLANLTIVARIVVVATEGLLIGSLISSLRDSRSRSTACTSDPKISPIPSILDEDRSRLLLESSRQSRNRLRLAIEEIRDYAIILLDIRGNILSWNSGAERILGYRANEVLGRSSDLFYEDRDIAIERPSRDLEVAAAEGQCEVEGWRVHRDRSKLWVKLSITTLRDDSGELRGFATVTRDMTDRRRFEEELQKAHDELEGRVLDRTAELAKANEALSSEIAERRRTDEALVRQTEVLRSILDNMAEAVLMIEEGNHVLPCNPAAERMFGMGPEGTPIADWQKSNLITVLNSSEDPQFNLSLISSAQGKDVNDLEVFIRSPGESEGRWALVNGRPLRDVDGTSTGAVIVYRDITERRRVAEELYRAKEAAEAASRAKDRFLASLSHELRTPLTPVLLAVTAMIDKPPTPRELPDILAMIIRNIELEARLIDDLLDLSRTTSGRLTMRAERLNAHAILSRSIELCRSEFEAANLTLELELAAQSDHVEGDSVRLHQIFWNLIKNAIKFTPHGGSIGIRTRDVFDPQIKADGPSLVIEISDTGIGIAPEALSKIFDPFEQGGPSIQRRYGGLGLGLAISRSLAEAHGGRLTAECDGPDLGSTFILLLPTAESSAPSLQQAANVTHGKIGLEILLVEDNYDTNRALALLLENRGHQVTSAACIAEAREAATLSRFDMLLSDIGLPDGSGLDLMRELSAAPDPAVIAGIAMSGFGSAEDIELSLKAGFFAHLTKPIAFGILESTILEFAEISSSTSAYPETHRV